MGPGRGLAVDGDDFLGQHLADRRHPGAEAFLAFRRCQQREDLPEPVVRRDAVRKLEKLPQPRLLGTPEGRDGHPVVRPADDRRGRDEIDEPMTTLARRARVFKDRKKPDRGWFRAFAAQLAERALPIDSSQCQESIAKCWSLY